MTEPSQSPTGFPPTVAEVDLAGDCRTRHRQQSANSSCANGRSKLLDTVAPVEFPTP
jgi:hypothetical protein